MKAEQLSFFSPININNDIDKIDIFNIDYKIEIMEDVKMIKELKVNEIYKIANDTELFCFDESDLYYYLCDFKKIDDNKYELDFTNVKIYNKKEAEFGLQILSVTRTFS